jgi:hypothetical protein
MFNRIGLWSGGYDAKTGGSRTHELCLESADGSIDDLEKAFTQYCVKR